MSLPFRLALTALAFATGVVVVSGYAPLGVKWPDGPITVHEQLGSFSVTLIDGSPNWNSAFEGGLAIWNSYLSRVQFSVVRDSTAPIADNNRINNVFFSSTIYGKAFGTNVIAVTTGWFNTTTNTRLEGDIIFNSADSWN